MSPSGIFPSVYMQPQKIVDLLVWLLNPIEKPPQKFLSITPEGTKHSIFIELLNQAGYICENMFLKNCQIEDFSSDSRYNLVFSLELKLKKILQEKDKMLKLFKNIHEQILKSSSYLVLEIKFGSEKDIDILEAILLESGFGSITVLIPDNKKEKNTNPFRSVDFSIHKYCWLTALSKDDPDEDPVEWMNEYFEGFNYSFIIFN